MFSHGSRNNQQGLTMNASRFFTSMIVVAGFAMGVTAQVPQPPPVPPQVLAGLRGVAMEAARNCEFFLSDAKRVSIRDSQQGQALAAIRTLRDAAKKYADATVSSRWPRPDWLRYCSETLLDAWINVDVTFPQLQAPPPVMDKWNRAQGALVALYNAAAPYMGKPAGGPLPMALGGGAAQPGVALPPGVVRETVPVRPGGRPVVK
jgi:hypothetical protein